MKKEWQTKTLEEVADSDCSLSYGIVQPGDEFADGLHVVRPTDLTTKVIELNQLKRIDPKLAAGYQRTTLQGGELLLCVRGSTGTISIASSELNGANVTRGIVPIRFKKLLLDTAFGYYLMVADQVQSQIREKTYGAALMQINIRDLRNIVLRFPPLAEQQRIVGLLDEAFEGLAIAKANAEKNLQNARALFESHLQSVFTQRNPGWVETTLGDVIEIVGGSQPPKSVFSKTKKADNIRLIQIRDYKSDRHIVFIPRAQAKRFCNANDVMIGRYGPPLFQILRGIEGAYNVALMKAVPNEAKLSRDFLFYFLKHSAILQYVIYHSSRAAGQIGVTKETLEPYPISLPSLAEQKTVVETIQGLETETQRLAHLYEQKLAALEALKKSLLHQAFTGEL